jgi:hypothetical protein
MLVCVVDGFTDCRIIIPNVSQKPLGDYISLKIGEKEYPVSSAVLFTMIAREFTPISYDSNSAIFTTRKKTVTINIYLNVLFQISRNSLGKLSRYRYFRKFPKSFFFNIPLLLKIEKYFINISLRFQTRSERNLPSSNL